MPATLAKLSLAKGSVGSLQQSIMSPFPSWSIQQEGSCSSLQSVVDLFLDPHGILWVLDNGIIDVLESPVNTCPPKIVAINARTGKVCRVEESRVIRRNRRKLFF